MVEQTVRPAVPSITAEGEWHAFLWENGSMTDLRTLGGGYSTASAINDGGEIVGESQTASCQCHAFLWKNGFMTDRGRRGALTVPPWP
jgi:probable HAF family extracellular repeat protein